MGRLIVSVFYEGFGPNQPEPDDNLFCIPVRTYPGALNTLDDVAKRKIAEIEQVMRRDIVLRSPELGSETSVVEGSLRKQRPLFEGEVENSPGGVCYVWFSYRAWRPPRIKMPRSG